MCRCWGYPMFSIRGRLCVGLLLFLAVSDCWSQTLEPRRWTHLPINHHFIGLASNYSTGDISFDPTLQIEDATMDLYTLGAGYIYSFNLGGKTARIEANLPYAYGYWEGTLIGQAASTRRHGFADPSLRFSVNLLGSPALQGKEFASFRAAHPVRTLAGVAVDLTLPLGEYRVDRLINLGGNRYVLRPQIGVLHQRQNWEFETTASVFLFGENDEFFRGTDREQDPLWFVQGHVIYNFQRGIWAGASGGYGYGGENTIDGVDQDDAGRVNFSAVSFGMPLSMYQSVKLTYAISQTNTRTGTDLGNLIVAWSMMF